MANITKTQSPNATLNFAGIGCNNQGWRDVKSIGTHDKVNVVAYCDIDEHNFRNVAKAWPGKPMFADYRKMFDKMGDDIDAVNVSTPDHMHAPITMEALRRGKHVYCEKPLTHTVWEARQIAKMAKKMGVTTRLGNQIHSEPQYRATKVMIQDGVIGKVKEIHTWIVSAGHGRAGVLSAPKQPIEAPAHISWDNWIGAGPMRPYGGDGIYHPKSWRDWQAYGSGAIGDNGCHLLDPLYTALDLTNPISITNNHTGLNDEVWPAQETIIYTFPGTQYTAKDQVRITWYDGGRRPNFKLPGTPSAHDMITPASLIIGEKGNLLVPHWGTPKLYPEADFADYKLPDVGKLNHWHDWVDACLSGEKISDDFAYAGPLTEAVQLGNVAAHFPGKTLKWDAAQLKITNLPEANAYLTKEYRKGWEVEAVV
ncbi:MAG: Gfo/Idh/MocA family oxidoreductase [Verrucomicrobiales bacterium]|nr:Gfo/Idh/MocA family oxidoreductase [Verrucomicrobiales bacterium]